MPTVQEQVNTRKRNDSTSDGDGTASSGHLQWRLLTLAGCAAVFALKVIARTRKPKPRKPRRHALTHRLMEQPATEFVALNPGWLVEVIEAAEKGLPQHLVEACKAPQLRRFEADIATFACAPGRPARESLYALDETTAYLNHGSYGAAYRLCLDVQQYFRDLLEQQPVRFMETTLLHAILASRDEVASFVRAAPGDVVPVQNVTTAVNSVVNSLLLQPGDLLMMTSLSYPAVRSTLAAAATKANAGLLEVLLDARSARDPQLVYRRMRRALRAARGRVKLVILDHIASFPPIHFEIKRLASLCHKHGALVMIDGSHAVGSLPLNIPSLGVDMYTANLHKWLCTPKGTAFLWVHPAQQHWVQPVVISHGYDTGFQGSFLWQGTRDDTAWCSVSAALRIFNTLGPETVRMRNHTLLTDALALVESVFGPRHVFGLLPGASCMVTLDLPPLPGNAPSPETAALVHQRLRVSYGVELPVVYWQRRLWVRLSAQYYNTLEEYQRLVDALLALGAARIAARARDSNGHTTQHEGQDGGSSPTHKAVHAAAAKGNEQAEQNEADEGEDEGEEDKDSASDEDDDDAFLADEANT